MRTTRLNRRDWLKKGMLTAGGVMAAPYFSFAETSTTPLQLDQNGDAIYSPFFKEYLPEDSREFPILEAKLNANENPYGPSPLALEALKNSAAGGNRYAWKELFQLVDKIAKFEGVSPKNIMMGPGSSDLLEKTAMVLFMNGGNVVSADPAYMSLIRVAEAAGGTWKPVPLKDDWSHDLKAMEAAIDAETKLVYICNPNNPTGTITDSEELLDFCSRVSEKVPVFVDEAYLWFLDDGAKKSVAQEATLDKLQKITRAGMGISYPSVFAAMGAMDDAEFIESSRLKNTACREYVYAELTKMGIEYVPSHTSFMIFPIEMEGKAFLQKMTELKVGVRAFNFMGKNWCRVSMGTMDEMKLFTAALGKVIV